MRRSKILLMTVGMFVLLVNVQMATAAVPIDLDPVYLKEFQDPDPDVPLRMALYEPELTGGSDLYRLKIDLSPHILEAYGWDLSDNMISGNGVFLSLHDPGFIVLAVEDDKAYFKDNPQLYFRETQRNLSNLARDYTGTEHHDKYGKKHEASDPTGIWAILKDPKFKAAGEFLIGLTNLGFLYSVTQTIDALKGQSADSWTVTTKRPGSYTWSSHDKGKKPYSAFTHEKVYDVQTISWKYLRTDATVGTRRRRGEGYDFNCFFRLRRMRPDVVTFLFVRAVIPYTRIVSTGGDGSFYPKGKYTTKYVEIEWRVPLPAKSGTPSKEVRSATARYELNETAVSWVEAQKTCTDRGGHLVAITSEKENDIVARLLRDNGVIKAWIGYTDKDEENRWQWVTGEEIYYENWASGEPNDAGGNEDLTEMCADDGTWNDWGMPTNTDQKSCYVCEFEQTASQEPEQVSGETVTPAKATKGSGPDLVIDKIYITDDKHVAIVVKNLGPDPLPDTVWTDHKPTSASVFLLITGKSWGGKCLWGLDPDRKLQKPGGTVTYISNRDIDFYRNWRGVKDYFYVMGLVDGWNEVAEADEHNNALVYVVEKKSE